MDAADCEPGAVGPGMAIDGTWDRHRRSDLDDCAYRPLGTDDIGDDARRHPVLNAGHHAVRLEVWRDQVRCPTRVVRLHEQEDDVERLAQGCDLAEVQRPYRDFE